MWHSQGYKWFHHWIQAENNSITIFKLPLVFKMCIPFPVPVQIIPKTKNQSFSSHFLFGKNISFQVLPCILILNKYTVASVLRSQQAIICACDTLRSRITGMHTSLCYEELIMAWKNLYTWNTMKPTLLLNQLQSSFYPKNNKHPSSL